MVHVGTDDAHAECLHLPRAAVRFPVEWGPPEGFRHDDASSWPAIDGRLEFLSGRIRYMPPCGGVQQDVASDVTTALVIWARTHTDFSVGSNEAGFVVGDAVRAADAGIWRRTDAGRPSGFRRVPPVLAVEVAGQDEGEAELRDKARWYLDVGVQIVWLVLPEHREVVVLTAAGESRHRKGDNLPEHPALPGLAPTVSDLFLQLDDTGSAERSK